MPNGGKGDVRAQKARARARQGPILALKKKIGKLAREGRTIPQELYDELASIGITYVPARLAGGAPAPKAATRPVQRPAARPAARPPARPAARPARVQPDPIQPDPVQSSRAIKTAQTASLLAAVAEIKAEGRYGPVQTGCKKLCLHYEIHGYGKRQNSAYQRGAKRCNTCRRFVKYDGHNCPCCGDRLHIDKQTAKQAAREFEKRKQGLAGWSHETEQAAMRYLGGHAGTRAGR